MTNHEHEAGKEPDRDAKPRYELSTQRALRLDRRQLIERVGRLGLGTLILAGGGVGMMARAVLADPNCWVAVPGGGGASYSDTDCTATQGPDASCGANAVGGGHWADEYCTAPLEGNEVHSDSDCGETPAGGGAVTQKDNDCGQWTAPAMWGDSDCGKTKNPSTNERYSDQDCGFAMTQAFLAADGACGFKIGGQLHEDGACGFTDPNSGELSVDANCGNQLGGLMDADQSCIARKEDADCGKGVDPTSISMEDNYCGTAQSAPQGEPAPYSADASCGTKHSAGSAWADEACGERPVGGAAEAVATDKDCGKGKETNAGEAHTDNDCGKKVGGTAQDPRVLGDSDCGKSAGGGAAHSDSDCDQLIPLADGGGYYTDQDCGKAKAGGGTHGDAAGAPPDPDPTPDPPDTTHEPTTTAPTAPGHP